MSVLLLTMGPQLGITADLPAVGVGGAGVIRFRPTGAVGPVKWTLVDSTLPAEWDSALNPDGDAVTLTTSDAETAGAFRVTVRAVDNARIPVVRSFDVRVMALPLTISGAFPEWEVGVPATGALTISGGVPPYSGLSITSGALPAGVSLSIVGNQIVPSGAPTVAGPWSATLQVSDSELTPALLGISGSVAATDPYWEHVVALLHFDGPDGSTTFTDQTGKTWTAVGNAQLDTAQSKFGGCSMALDGAGDRITTPSNASLGFGTGDFTIECFARSTNVGSRVGILFDLRAAGVTGIAVFMGGGAYGAPENAIGCSSNSTIMATGGSLVNNQWYHIAVTRQGTTVRGFVDGVKVFEVTDSRTYASSAPCVIGGDYVGTADQHFPGWVDEIRITKGVARYTANFTPPDRAFPDQ